MLKLINNTIIYSNKHCQQCGICKSVCPKQVISFELQKDGTHKVIVNNNKCIKCKRCVNSCPANKFEGYKIYFDNFKDKTYFLGYNSNDKVRRESSSGGVCKTLIIEGLRSGNIDGVYTLKKTDKYPYAEGEFYTKENIPDYCDLPNSIYHSVMACTNINRIEKCNRLMIVGTSCQLRALEKIAKNKCNELIKICIFCKQQKTLDSTRFLAKIIGEKINNDKKFYAQYRGMGWPGIVKINNSSLPYHRAAQLPFGRRLWTVPGCDVCGDSYGIESNADITLMDPWIIRERNEFGETLITVHTERGLKILKDIPNIVLEAKSYTEVEPALSLKDVWRKQQLVPFFRGEECGDKIIKAGKAEFRQRKILSCIAKKLPRMPILFYRVLCKFPDLRNKILK